MKKLIYILLLFVSCKKEEIKNNTTQESRDIKYEVSGTCCYLEVEHDGIKYTSSNSFTWSYDFKPVVGSDIVLKAKSTTGANQAWTLIKIYQSGSLISQTQGYGLQQLNYKVK